MIKSFSAHGPLPKHTFSPFCDSKLVQTVVRHPSFPGQSKMAPLSKVELETEQLLALCLSSFVQSSIKGLLHCSWKLGILTYSP